jgi:hypothetical protein
VHKRIISAVRRVEFVRDRMLYIIRCRWCITVVNLHAPCEDTSDDIKDSFYEELGRVFYQFPRHDMKILLGDFNAKVGTQALKEEGSEAECQRRVTCRRVRVVTAAAPDERERAALRRGQLTSDRAEAHQSRRIDLAGVTEGDRVRPHRPARRRKKESPLNKHRPHRQRGPPGPVPP